MSVFVLLVYVCSFWNKKKKKKNLFGRNPGKLSPGGGHAPDSVRVGLNNLSLSIENKISLTNSARQELAQRAFRDRTGSLGWHKMNENGPVLSPNLLGTFKINLECPDRTHALQETLVLRGRVRDESPKFNVRIQGLLRISLR